MTEIEIETPRERGGQRENWEGKAWAGWRRGDQTGRGQSRIAPRSREGCGVDGDPAAGALPVQDPDAHVGTCGATGDAVFLAPAWAGFRTGRPRHPSPRHRARGDPELEKTPRQAPRPGGGARDRKVSRKREAQVRKQHLLPRLHPPSPGSRARPGHLPKPRRRG